jgi:hypothetical protein
LTADRHVPGATDVSRIHRAYYVTAKVIDRQRVSKNQRDVPLKDTASR